jgi:hypothetical protein
MYLSAPLPRTIFQGALDGATNAITSTYPNIASPFFPDVMLNNFSVSYCGSFRMRVGSFGYLHAPRTCSTKPFMKRLSSCGGKSLSIFMFLALCSPTCNTLFIHQPRLSRATLVLASPNVVAWAHLDTDTIPNNAPPNRLQNGYVPVEIYKIVFSTFVLMLTSCPALTLARFV